MGGSTRKVNFIIEERLCRDLEDLVPAGQRSRFVNQALRKELELFRRRKALDKLQAAPTVRKKFTNREIVEALVRERSCH
jgi:hypothetical protein